MFSNEKIHFSTTLTDIPDSKKSVAKKCILEGRCSCRNYGFFASGAGLLSVILLNFIGPKYTAPSNRLLLPLLTVSGLENKKG